MKVKHEIIGKILSILLSLVLLAPVFSATSTGSVSASETRSVSAEDLLEEDRVGDKLEEKEKRSKPSAGEAKTPLGILALLLLPLFLSRLPLFVLKKKRHLSKDRQ